MFLQLDWSPPAVHSIDLTWFGKAHTCLYSVPQLTLNVKAKNKPRGHWNCPYQNISASLKVPKNTVASIIVKWKKFGTTKTPPRAAQTEQSGEKGLGWGGDQDPDVHSDKSYSVEIGEPSRRTNISFSTPPIRPLWYSGQTEASPQ
jgi:hypothetical protein